MKCPNCKNQMVKSGMEWFCKNCGKYVINREAVSDFLKEE